MAIRTAALPSSLALTTPFASESCLTGAARTSLVIRNARHTAGISADEDLVHSIREPGRARFPLHSRSHRKVVKKATSDSSTAGRIFGRTPASRTLIDFSARGEIMHEVIIHSIPIPRILGNISLGRCRNISKDIFYP